MERWKTIVQLSSVVRKRAIVPPKLQTIAEAITKAIPARSPERRSPGKGPAAAGKVLDMALCFLLHG